MRINFLPYLKSYAIGLQNEQAYRLDLFMRIFKYAFSVIFLSVIWIKVGASSDSPLLSPSGLIAYYISTATIFGLANFHTWYVEEDIKLGYLSKFLVKPLSPYWMYFMQQAASASIDLATKLVVFAPVIFWLQPAGLNPLSLLMFCAYLPIVYYFSFTFFFCMSSLSFWLQDVYALRWAWFGLFRFISGIWVPLYLFPPFWQKVSFYLPFSHLVYTPAQLLQGAVPIDLALQGLVVLSVWSLLVTALRIFVWHRGLLAYESTGV